MTKTLQERVCGKYLGDNDGTCPQLTCIRKAGHVGPCDNTQGDTKTLQERARDIFRLLEHNVGPLELEMLVSILNDVRNDALDEAATKVQDIHGFDDAENIRALKVKP